MWRTGETRPGAETEHSFQFSGGRESFLANDENVNINFARANRVGCAPRLRGTQDFSRGKQAAEKTPWTEADSVDEAWQGLKPDSIYWPFSARLKPCPGYRALHFSSYEFFSSL